jgi:hypothetical protein
MANTMTRLAKAQGNSFNLTNIPQTYTDLLVVVSGRDLTSGGGVGQTQYMTFSGDGAANYSSRWMEFNGTSIYMSSNSSQTGARLCVINSTGATSSLIFGGYQIYIPNYTSASYKQWMCEYVTENNGTGAYSGQAAGLWRNTAAITSISMGTGFSIDSNSEVTLYGITNT